MRRRAIPAALLIAAAGLIGYTSLPSVAATAPAAGNTYQVAAVNSTKCIEIPSGSTANSPLLEVNNPFYYDTGGLKQTGGVMVSCTGQQETGGTTFTPSSFYSHTLDPAANVPARVKMYAGPQATISM